MTRAERDPLNEAAYRAYRASVLVRGRDPEEWHGMSARRRRSWRAAAKAVLDFLEEGRTSSAQGEEPK
jgi:ribosome modulation factor